MSRGFYYYMLLGGVVCVILNCSQDNNSVDTMIIEDSVVPDIPDEDVYLNDAGEDTKVVPDNYFAISFKESNEILFFERRDFSDKPFFSLKTGVEISSVEFDSDTNTLIYASRDSKEVVFIRDFNEIKRIQDIGDYPYSMKYIPKLKLLIIPDRSSNRISIIDTEKLDLSSISPMTAGGNSPISVCSDESPLTQGLLVRLFILVYSSLYVRAYDIFDKEDWGLRGERLPALSEPLYIACDSVNRRLLIANSASNNISVYGLDDLVQIANSPFEAGINPSFIVMNSGASVAYVLNTSEDSMTIFSTVEMKTKGGISFKTGDSPSRAYVDENESRLYILLKGSRKLQIYDISKALLPEKLNEIEFSNTPLDLVYK